MTIDNLEYETYIYLRILLLKELMSDRALTIQQLAAAMHCSKTKIYRTLQGPPLSSNLTLKAYESNLNDLEDIINSLSHDSFDV